MWMSVLSTTLKNSVWRNFGRHCATSVISPLNESTRLLSSQFLLTHTQAVSNISHFNILNEECRLQESALRSLTLCDFGKYSVLQSNACSPQSLRRNPHCEVSPNIYSTLVEDEWLVSSVVKKRRLKMNKHKYRKRRKRDRQRSK